MRKRVAVRRSRAASWSRPLGAVALPMLALGALGHRHDLVSSEAMFAVLVVGFSLAAAASGLAVYALVDIWESGAAGAGRAIAGLLYAAPVLALLALSLYAVAAYPRLNDVSTDPDDPPEFESLTAEHAVAPADAAARVALQREAYPEVTARLYPVGIERLYQAASALVAERGWTVALDRPPSDSEAVIEAMARTPIFAFADNVAIRLVALPEGTRLDMRSRSRIGEHDLGQNARRILAFLADLDAALQGEREAEAPAEAESAEPAAPQSEESR